MTSRWEDYSQGRNGIIRRRKIITRHLRRKAREVKVLLLRVPHGEWGKVVNVRVSPGRIIRRVNTKYRSGLHQKRPISVGDKMAGRHGNKGVVSIIARLKICLSYPMEPR